MVDATPDSSHFEQTTFIIRYLTSNQGQIEIVEIFLTFADCSEKNGSAIASLILKTLKENEILLTDCQRQGYDKTWWGNTKVYKAIYFKRIHLPFYHLVVVTL